MNSLLYRAQSRITRIVKRKIFEITAPRMKSAIGLADADFLQRFALDEVARPLAQGDLAAARDALLAHYAQRAAPPWPNFPFRPSYMQHNVYELETAELTRIADGVVANCLPRLGSPPVEFGATIDWSYDRELNIHDWLAPLTLAYQQTGDTRYAEKFVAIIQDWIQQNPALVQKDETHHAWRLMEVGMRALQWIAAFGAFYADPAFTPDAKLLMLRSLYDHGTFLLLNVTNRNHLIRESIGLLALSLYFPEFKEAEAWQTAALHRLTQAVIEQINADGSDIEVSTGYQFLVAEELGAVHELLQVGGIALANIDLADTLEKLYELLVHLARPDGSFPQVNDGFFRQTNLAQDLVRQGERLGRADFVFVGSQGRRGTPPAATSRGFDYAGFYVMRSDWTPDARYLLFDAGPYGGPHGHEDKLNIEVYAYGHPFLVDPGTYTYAVQDPYRTYFMSSHAHNTLLVDGHSQFRRRIAANMDPQAGTQADATWITQPEFDYAAATYQEGYGEFCFDPPASPPVIDDVIHTRRVLFVKPDYWIVVDEIQAAQEHDYQLLFQTDPNVTVETDQARAHLEVKDSHAHLLLVPADPELQVTMVSGCEAPIQGWYSPEFDVKEASTTIRYAVGRAASTVLATLLYPSREPVARTDLSLESLPVTGGTGHAFAVQTPKGTDYLLLASGPEMKTFGGYSSARRVAGVRTDAQGRVSSRFEGG